MFEQQELDALELAEVEEDLHDDFGGHQEEVQRPLQESPDRVQLEPRPPGSLVAVEFHYLLHCSPCIVPAPILPVTFQKSSNDLEGRNLTNGLQYPYSEQQGANPGQPWVHLT